MRSSVPPTMRIGELAARVGVSTHVLRAWESRYGLLNPTRTPSGYRVYGPNDERRVLEVVRLRASGVSAADAVSRVLAAERVSGGVRETSADVTADGGGDVGGASATTPRGTSDGSEQEEDVAPYRVHPPVLVVQLFDAICVLDEDRAQSVLDLALAQRSVESVIVDVVMPLLAMVGEAWAAGRLNIAQEHFTSGIIRRRLGALSLTWGSGRGPIAVLACPPGELHDLALLGFGVILGRAGWRVRYLGTDTPSRSLIDACRTADVDAVIVASRRPDLFRSQIETLRSVNEKYPLWLAGRGATPRVLEEIGCRALGPSLPEAVATLNADVSGRVRG